MASALVGTQSGIASVIYSAPSTSDQVPSSALLMFPPFPHGHSGLVPFDRWSCRGVWLRNHHTDESQQTSVDSLGNSLATLDQQRSILEKTIREEEKKVRRLASCAHGVRLLRKDCFRIGIEGDDWQEPKGTSLSDYDISIPPFSRLIAATRDFLYSRHEEFQFTRTKRLFDLMRNAFGLHTRFPGRHWSGSGPDGQPYVGPSSRQAFEHNFPHDISEVCVLLSNCEDSVRGFLALSRKEAEAGWEFAPALQLADITSAFLSFVSFHRVLSESELTTSIAQAAKIARSARRQLLEAKILEEQLCNGMGWNRASWTVWGGQYGGVERGGLEYEESSWPVSGDSSASTGCEVDDGGWKVESITPFASSLVAPVSVGDVKLRGHIPYSRRRVVEVRPPLSASHSRPTFKSALWQLITVPSPWTTAEKWRKHHVMPDDDFEGNGSTDGEASSEPLLEGEKATIAEPSEIIIWIEEAALRSLSSGTDGAVGMGLRGRWALMGAHTTAGEDSWWTFKAKDYVLPALWKTGAQ